MRFPGGQRALKQLVEEHYLSLYRFAYRLSGSATEAEDLTQEAYCQAQEKFHQLREPHKAKAWLFSILRNLYLHRQRAEKKGQVVSLEAIPELPESSSPPASEFETDQLQNALNELPEVYRTPVILYYFEDFSYRDIAEQMDLPLGTVMSRLARAKNHLRSRLLALMPDVLAETERRARDGL